MKKEERQKQVQILCKKGKTQKEMAQILQVSIPTISKDIKKLKIHYMKVHQRIYQKTIQEIQTLWEDGNDREAIAEKLNISYGVVCNYINDLIENQHEIEQQEKREEQKQKIRRMYEAEKSQKEIAETLKVTYPRANVLIRRMCEEEGIEYKSDNQRKREMQIARMKKLYKAGKTEAKDIMKETGLGQTIVYKYLKEVKEEIESEEQEQYMQECRENMENGTLEKIELEHIKQIVEKTKTYKNMVTYVKACIQWRQIEKAKDILVAYKNSETFSRRAKEKDRKIIRTNRIDRKKKNEKE